MKSYLLFFVLLTLTGWTYAQGSGSIDNIAVSQRSGEEERVVDIQFDLNCSDYSEYNISLKVSFDDGDTFTTIDPDEVIEGDLTVAPATDIQLVWDGRISFSHDSAENARIRINAEPASYSLSLNVEPENSGQVSGGGIYKESVQVTIAATPEEGWEFVNWTGDTDHVDNPASANPTVTMPADDVTLTANFEEEDDSDIIYGDGVTDIDGNEYITVIIGEQEWMTENLRVTKYNNGDDIPSSLSDEDWQETTDGAYAIYPHEDVDGINSPEEMVDAYGKLYNWYAVDDDRGLCPEGWSVPSDAEWTELTNYLINNYDDITSNNVGNKLKSCRQVDSDLGGECDTSEHPRWSSHSTHYGFDEFGFSALPGGSRRPDGSFSNLGTRGRWWSSTEDSSDAWGRIMFHFLGGVTGGSSDKAFGFSLRCVRDID